MRLLPVPIWKEAPFIRLLVPLATGIFLQWHAQLPVLVYWIIIPICLAGLILFAFFSSFKKYKNYWITGAFIHVLMAASGGSLAYYNDIRHQPHWINHFDLDHAFFIASLTKPLTEKDNSYSTIASLDYLCTTDSCKKTTGKLLLYFEKNETNKKLGYNSCIIFRKHLQPIRNSGNPGAFNYERYCAFADIYHQVFLKTGEYRLIPSGTISVYKKWLFSSRERVINILQQNIRGKKEAGLAEALLIGYKSDLDKALLQSYSNTGVVHVIAISGLHLGLIYWLMTLLLHPVRTARWLRWIKPFIVLSGLWSFSFLAGGSASVLRSAVMFSFIVLGESFRRPTSIYNSLAGSAFVLLCLDPFLLWDAGFQLSYVAVLSIVIFMTPIYDWFYIRNKVLDHIWKLISISIAAQVLTTPVSIYHFHQFPVYFLVTNLVAVPLSSLIVLGEIWLCCISTFAALSSWTGLALEWLITLINGFIEHMERMPFPTLDNLLINDLQLMLLYVTIILMSIWLMKKNSRSFMFALCSICGFVLAGTITNIQALAQQKLIIYNVPRFQAIDVILGSRYTFLGDPEIKNNSFIEQFHLKPSRIIHRASFVSTLPGLKFFREGIWIKNNKILILSRPVNLELSKKYEADLVIISKNARIKMEELVKAVKCRQFVFDGTNSARKIMQWKAVCEKSGIGYHAVAEKGAFIFNLN